MSKSDPITNGAKMAARNAKGQLLPGHPGGPGRPRGSRHKLSEEFLAALLEDFNENGVAAIAAVRLSDPSSYLKTIASIVPKTLDEGVGEGFAEAFERYIRDLNVLHGNKPRGAPIADIDYSIEEMKSG
jgi:hypothetical protein